MNLGTRNLRPAVDLLPTTDDHCPKRACRARLRMEVQLGGTVVAICDPCDRNRRGLCRLCPKPLTHKGRNRGNAQFCDDCRVKTREEYQENWYQINRDDQLSRAKKRHRTHRAERLAYAKEYRRLHPPPKRDDIDRMYHRDWARNAYKDPAYREREIRRRNRIRLAKRKERVLAGEADKLTDRDVIWIWEKALGRRLQLVA